MHRTLLPKIPILLLVFCVLQAAAQTKPSGEVNVEKCWAHPAGDAIGGPLASDGTRLFIGFEGAKVDALSIDGKKAWSTDFGGEIRSNLMPGPTNLLVVTSTVTTDASKPGDPILRSLSKETGITSWTLKLEKADRFFLGSWNDTVILVSSSGLIEALGAKDQTVKWKLGSAQTFVAEPVFDKENVTVATASNQFLVVSLATGEIVSILKFPVPVTSLGRNTDGDLIVGNERGEVLLFVKNADKPYWKFKSGGGISQVGDAGGSVLAVSHDNFIYLLAGRNGSVVWKKRMPGRISAASMYAGKYVVVSGVDEHTLMLLDVSNGKVAGQVLLAGDETVTSLQPSTSRVLLLTNLAAYAYSLDSCAK